MLDVLLGFLALYFVDVAGFSSSQAGLGVAVWTGMGLLGDFLLILLLLALLFRASWKTKNGSSLEDVLLKQTLTELKNK